MQIFSNNGSTTLAASTTALDTAITVVDASDFPAGEFKVTLEDKNRTFNEIVLVTGVVGNVLTVVRAQEGTTARVFALGDTVENRLTAQWLNDLQTSVHTLVDDTTVATDKTYSSDKVLQLHNAQAEAIAYLSGASATFSSTTSQVVPEEPTAKVNLVWVNGQASNADIFTLGTNEINFYVDGNYSFLNTVTLYRLNDGSTTTVTFELYDADTAAVVKSVNQAVDMTAGTKETMPLNVLVPITGASTANPVRLKVRMGMTAANGTLELFSFSSVLVAQAIASTGSGVYSKVEYTATAGQTTFTTGYDVGMVDVYLNGLKLSSTQFTAIDGTTVVLGTALDLGDKVELIKYSNAGVVQGTYNKYNFVATDAQTTFTVSYTPGYVDVYHNGLKLAAGDFVATNSTSVVLSTAAMVGDAIEVIAYGIFNVANTEKGVANGVATLDAGGKVPTTQIPSYVNDAVTVVASQMPSVVAALVFGR